MLMQQDHKETEPHVHGGCLSSSVVAKQGGDVALVEGNIQVVDGNLVTVHLGEAVEGNTHWEM